MSFKTTLLFTQMALGFILLIQQNHTLTKIKHATLHHNQNTIPEISLNL